MIGEIKKKLILSSLRITSATGRSINSNLSFCIDAKGILKDALRTCFEKILNYGN
jgi:hypothetical protein